MSPSELKRNVSQTGSLFFTKEAMRFSGDTMKNYGVRSLNITNNMDENVDVWELYRKNKTNTGLKSSAYFDKKTFKRVHIKIEY